MYQFKRDLSNKISLQTSSVASQAGWGRTSLFTPIKAEGPSLINNTTLELLIKLGFDESKESLEALINKIKELTIKEERKFIETDIRLCNNLPT